MEVVVPVDFPEDPSKLNGHEKHGENGPLPWTEIVEEAGNDEYESLEARRVYFIHQK